jgi:hypothetical protein
LAGAVEGMVLRLQVQPGRGEGGTVAETVEQIQACGEVGTQLMIVPLGTAVALIVPALQAGTAVDFRQELVLALADGDLRPLLLGCGDTKILIVEQRQADRLIQGQRQARARQDISRLSQAPQKNHPCGQQDQAAQSSRQGQHGGVLSGSALTEMGLASGPWIADKFAANMQELRNEFSFLRRQSGDQSRCPPMFLGFGQVKAKPAGQGEAPLTRGASNFILRSARSFCIAGLRRCRQLECTKRGAFFAF